MRMSHVFDGPLISSFTVTPNSRVPELRYTPPLSCFRGTIVYPTRSRERTDGLVVLAGRSVRSRPVHP